MPSSHSETVHTRCQSAQRFKGCENPRAFDLCGEQTVQGSNAIRAELIRSGSGRAVLSTSQTAPRKSHFLAPAWASDSRSTVNLSRSVSAPCLPLLRQLTNPFRLAYRVVPSARSGLFRSDKTVLLVIHSACLMLNLCEGRSRAQRAGGKGDDYYLSKNPFVTDWICPVGDACECRRSRPSRADVSSAAACDGAAGGSTYGAARDRAARIIRGNA